MERESINLVLEAVKVAEQDIGLVLQEESLRILSVLATAGRPLRRVELASLSGFDPEAGAFEYRLKKLSGSGLIEKVRQNGSITYYDLTDIGRHKVRGIIGLLKYVAQKRLDEVQYAPHKERIIAICMTIDTIFSKLEQKGYVSILGNKEAKPVHELRIPKQKIMP